MTGYKPINKYYKSDNDKNNEVNNRGNVIKSDWVICEVWLLQIIWQGRKGDLESEKAPPVKRYDMGMRKSLFL